jgi:hypothetical protein
MAIWATVSRQYVGANDAITLRLRSPAIDDVSLG